MQQSRWVAYSAVSDIVIIDDLPTHKRAEVRQIIEAACRAALFDTPQAPSYGRRSDKTAYNNVDAITARAILHELPGLPPRTLPVGIQVCLHLRG